METPEQKIELHKEVRKQTIGYIIAALGLVAGLAWNEAIKELIGMIIPLGAGSLIIKFAYAIIITLIVVLASVYLVKDTKK